MEDMEKKHQFEANKKYFIISIYAFCVVVLSVITIYVLWHNEKVLSICRDFTSKISVFLVAFFIAYFMNPLVKFFDKIIITKLFKVKSNKLRIGLSILLSYVFVIACIVAILVFIFPEVYYSIADLTETVSKSIPAISKRIVKFLNELEHRFPWFDWNNIEKQVQTSLPSFMKITTDFLTYFLKRLQALYNFHK